jgi:tetratricopeptide (TPR) repeat protein
MSSKALISGQAGVAVLLRGPRVQSFHLDGPEGLDRRREEISQIFGDCTDVVVVEDIEPEAVSARLELEWAKQRCLSLCLLLLDIESHPESRQLAVADIEEFLRDPEVASFLRARLFVAPLPENADLIGAINRAHSQNATSLVGILEEVGVHQEEIDRCRSSWDALPAHTFRDESSKEGVAFALVQVGAFHQVVTTAAEKRGALLLRLLVQPQFQQWRVGLTTWINSLSSKNRATNRAADEEEQKGSRRRRPVKQARISGEARLDVVNRQKDAIRKALAAGDLNQARAFCVDLLAYQERNSRPEHIAKSFCDLAQSAKDLGHPQLQLEWTQKAVDVAPGDGWSLTQLGDAYRCLGQWSDAQAAFGLAFQHGEVRVARNGQAEVFTGMGRLEDALREYESNVKEFPADVVARNGRAEVLKGMGRLEEALREYESIVKEFPADVFARTGRAEVLKGMGRLEDALREYESIAKEFQPDVVARNGLAEVLKGMGRLEDALREYESIAKEFPEDVVARSGRAEVLKGMGRLEDALREYESIAKEFPQNVVARNGLAEVLKGMGRLEAALREYESIAKEFPQNVVARNGRADVLKGMGRLEDALREYESIAEEFPQSVFARSGRAEVLKGMGRLEEALREYESIAREFPQNVVAQTGRADVLKGMGRLEEALREYESTAKEFPADVFARTGRAEVLKAMGRLEDALREYESTAKEFPQNVVARNGAASVCVLMADYESATAWIGPSVDTEPVNWVGLHILGMIRLRTGRAAEAVALFERGLRDGPFEDRRIFRSALAYARLLAHDLKQAASILEDEPSVVSRVLQIHVYGELNQKERARQAYDGVRSNRNPRVIELAAELVARARLEMRAPTRSAQWVLDREFELLLAA